MGVDGDEQGRFYCPKKTMYDICAIGELIIDFTPVGVTEQGTPLFACNPGGAPGNVMACLSRLGKSAAFIGKVGKDQFGSFFKQVLGGQGMETRGIIEAEDANTTLAFVHINESGDRSFSFYRKNCADILLQESEIDYGLLEESRAFHFGSVSMTDEPARSATFAAAAYAKNAGKLVSYDPNYRPNLWMQKEQAKAAMLQGMEYADVVKVSEEELAFLTGEGNIKKMGRSLCHEYDLSILLVTMGCKGACCITKEFAIYQPTFDVKTVDTNGAGDASMGGFLFSLMEQQINPKDITQQEARICLEFANVSGALATTKSGAIPAMPSYEEVLNCISRQKRCAAVLS